MKKYFLIKKDNLPLLAKKLSKKYGLPCVNTVLSLFYYKHKNVIEISFVNGHCHSRIYNKKTDKVSDFFLDAAMSTPPIYIENKNIKFFLKTLYNFGLNEAVINTIFQFDYRMLEDSYINIQIGTIVGDLLAIDEHFAKDVTEHFSSHIDRQIIIEDIDKSISEGAIKKSLVFDNLGILSGDVKVHMNRFGIDISLNHQTIETKLSAKTNDYLFYNDLFCLFTGSKLTDGAPNEFESNFFKPISIVIPSYNSEETVIKTLLSIESQYLPDECKQRIQVTVVDDGSKLPVIKVMEQNNIKFSFDLNIIRLEKNGGRANACNIGACASNHEYLLFLDADILLPKNFLYEHLLRLQIIPDSIFLSLKKNIDRNSEIVKADYVAQGLNTPSEYNDKRLSRVLESGMQNLYPISQSGSFEFLGETDYFANFGSGRMINGYDLPSLVVGHNMSMTKKLFNSIGGFSCEFVGWGLEDTYLGACIIARGGFVIPIVNTGVYHINHLPRSGSEDARKAEYEINMQTYHKLITKEL